MCSYFSIDPTSASYGKTGGSGSFTITAPSGCSWTATVEYDSLYLDIQPDSWITITSGSSGSGNKTVKYSVPENTGSFRRTAKIIVGGQTFTVDQERGDFGVVCMTCSMSPNSASYDASGGSGSFNVDVRLRLRMEQQKVMTTGSRSLQVQAGMGDGPVSYSVAANNGSERTGTITVTNKTFTVTQGELPRPPGPPTGVSASDGTYTDKVRITWKAPTTGGTKGYRIYRATANNAGSATEIGMSTGTW